MAYKVSYKVVSEQGEQLKKAAKDMDDYISRLNGIVSKLGSDSLLQSVRSDLKKFQQQLETEKTVLDLAGQVLIEVVQSYSGAEKKSVAKVDKLKAHSRDFYKRPVVVASAGAGAGATATASATAYATGVGSATSINQTVVNNTYIINESASAGSGAASGFGGMAGAFSESAIKGAGEAAGTAAAIGAAALAGGVAASAINEKRKEKNENKGKEEKKTK